MIDKRVIEAPMLAVDDARLSPVEELDAIVEGQTPYRSEVKQALGEHSVAALEIDAVHRETNERNANFRFLTQSFLKLMPVPDQKVGYAVKDSQDQQYTVRALQEHIVWRAYSNQPRIIIGRKCGDSKSKTDQLMVMGGDIANSLILVLDVKKRNLKHRDTIIDEVKNAELSSAEVKVLMLPNSTTMAVKPDRFTPNIKGDIRYEYSDFLCSRSSFNRVAKHSMRIEQAIGIRPSMEDMHAFNVYEHLAKIATAFGFEDEYRKLLSGDTSGRSDTSNPSSTSGLSEQVIESSAAEKLRTQNSKLKGALAAALVGSGLMTREEIDALIEEKYPTISE